MSKKNACIITYDDDGFEYHCLWDEECCYRIRSKSDPFNHCCHESGDCHCKNTEAQLRALDDLEQRVKAGFIRLRNEREKNDN